MFLAHGIKEGNASPATRGDLAKAMAVFQELGPGGEDSMRDPGSNLRKWPQAV